MSPRKKSKAPEPVERLKLVISDFHLGRGRKLPQGGINLLEDFVYDHRFKEWLDYYSEGVYENTEIELIFNGDMMNLIQVDYHGHYPVVITEHISASKMEKVIAGHKVFFDSLADFLAPKNRSLTYVIGNHDQEMLWPSVRAMFEKAIDKSVNWKNIFYQVDGVYIEHGHQYEAVNRIDPAKPFLTENLPEPILNLPWGTLFAVQWITKLKQHRPAIDKVRPFRMVVWWSLFHDTWMAIQSLLSLAAYFLTTRFSKNRTRQTSLKMTLRILREASVFPDLTDAARRILRTPDIHTVVFGHTHVYKQVQVTEEKQYINTGTWTDIISLDLETYARRVRLTYVRIEYTGEKSQANLRHWIGQIPLEDDALAS